MSNYIYYRTIPEGSSRNRLRVLANQTFQDGKPIPTNLNVQADTAVRNASPIGTVFASASVVMKGSDNSAFLSAIGQLYPVDDIRQTTPRSIQEDYKKYLESCKAKGIRPTDEVKTENVNTKTETNEKTDSLVYKLRHDSAYAVPTIDEDGFSIDEKKWTLAMTFICNHDNLLVTGPSGTGKTELIMLACKKLGLSCRKYNMGTMSDPMSALLGVHRIKNGQSVFEQSQFLEDIQKPGVILLDELNRAPLNALNYLMSCLDGTRTMRNDYVSPVQEIPVHPDCTFIATANIGSEFVGTNILDPALSSRFFRLKMDYPTVEEETKILTGRYGISTLDARNIALSARDVRQNKERGELSETVTVRQTLMCAKLVSCGYSSYEALSQIFLPLFEGDENEGEASIVAQILKNR